MEILTSLLNKYSYAVGGIAVFCYSLIVALRRVPAIKDSSTFKAWLPLLPVVLGAALGACLPWLFPPTDPAILRAFVGTIAGANAGVVVATIRRIAKLLVTKKSGEAAAETIFAAVDEGGSTLPPETDDPDAPKPFKRPTPKP